MTSLYLAISSLNTKTVVEYLGAKYLDDDDVRECIAHFFEDKAQPEAVELLNYFGASPYAKHLYTIAQALRWRERIPLVRLQIIYPEEQTLSTSEGNVEYEAGIITINGALSVRKRLHVFVFELCNLLNRSRFEKVHKKLKQNKFTSGLEFAYRVLRVEYKSAQMHDRILLDSVQGRFWNKALAELTYSLHSFGQLWERTLQSGHVAHYASKF